MPTFREQLWISARRPGNDDKVQDLRERPFVERPSVADHPVATLGHAPREMEGVPAPQLLLLGRLFRPASRQGKPGCNRANSTGHAENLKRVVV